MKMPLGRKAYASIPHLPGSRAGVDRHVPERQARRLTQEAPPGFEVVIQEKLDGSCVAVARLGDEVLALGRQGDLAAESRNAGRRLWAKWVRQHASRFRALLRPGERLVGEWLALAHSTRYVLRHEPFVPFDLMHGDRRMTSRAMKMRLAGSGLRAPFEVHRGAAMDPLASLRQLARGGHGAVEAPEGVVYRLESEEDVSLIAKYIRAGKVDGVLLEENSGHPPIWNWLPETT